MASAFDQSFDEIVARVAAGEALTAILKSAGINKSTFDAHLRKRPDLRSRLRAARPLTGKALVRAKFDEVLASIRSGANATEAIEASGCGMSSFFKVVKADAELHKQFAAALAERGGKTAKGRWDDTEIDSALDALSSSPTVGRLRVLADGPSQFAVFRRAERDPEFRARLDAILGERAKARESLKKPPERVFEQFLLRRGLLDIDLFRLADRAAAGLDPEDRDDVTSEIILAVLEGEITEQEIRTKGKALARRKVFGMSAWNVSLDDKGISGEATSIGERRATPCQIIHY